MDKAYRVYVTDAVRLISENTAHYGGGSYISCRFADLYEPKKAETRTAEQVRDDIRAKIRAL